nr:HAMP domain-containing sensor histidine kinase [Patulibacter sp. SYSU D01012]
MLLAGWLLAVAAASVLLAERRCARRRTERIVRACHELRGPLTTVMLALDAGDREPAARRDGRGELLPAVALELARARRAVEDLGAAARGRTGRDERRAVDVHALVRDLVAVHDVAARAAGRHVVLLPGAGDAVVLGDRARLAQAIGNLVHNALEHGQGTVRVGVAVRDGAVHVEVADDGHGLRVPVERLLASAARGQRGRGMRIVADALASHGGRLRAAPPGGGARLVAELPAATPVSSRAVPR